MGREMTRAPPGKCAASRVGWVPGTDAAARRASRSQPHRRGSEDARLGLPSGRRPRRRAPAPRQSHPKPGERAAPPAREPRPARPEFRRGPQAPEPRPPARRPFTFLPLPSRGSGSARPAPRAAGEAVVFGPAGGGGGAAAPGASSASLPPWYTARPSEMWMLGAQPMLAAARGHAGGQPRSGQQTARPAPRGRRGRRVIAAWAGGRRRRARVSRQEVRPPLLSRCGRGGGGGGAGEGALGRAARRGRPSEHALPEAGAAGRLPHIAALAWPRRASGEFRGRRFALSPPGRGQVRAARATPPWPRGGATPGGGALPAAPAAASPGPQPAPLRLLGRRRAKKRPWPERRRRGRPA